MLFFYFLTNNTPTSYFFFFNDPATTEIYTLSLHDALPIYDFALGVDQPERVHAKAVHHAVARRHAVRVGVDRKSTRLNSSHANISYAVFCLKKKKDISIRIALNLNDTIIQLNAI